MLGVVALAATLSPAVAADASIRGHHGVRAPRDARPAPGVHLPTKAPTRAPSRPVDRLDGVVSEVDPLGPQSPGSAGPPTTSPVAAASATLLAAVADSTPPSAPTQLSAQAQSLSTITASWTPAQDPESGISSYVFAVGTNSSGNGTSLANVRWWQVTYATSISVNLSLDPSLTYYVSVYAVNGAGLSSPFATSSGVRPTAPVLGQPGNVMQLRFAATGLDASGNATTGWTADQTAVMSSFFTKMYPLLVQLYGPPADSYTVTVVRDLKYTGSNIFIPSLDEIHMADGFFPQLFTHELVHAFRNDHLLSSDQNWAFDATLSGFEESFAQAVSYDAMNLYVAAYPNDAIVAGNTLWGSSNDWDYDFQNVPELRGTDFWSDGGGTGLY